ncbi:MAG: DUF3418 domain-containing protein [Oxalobacteraceae bacterium]|nr:MAG: DUF3418 domain-containing protein [Oxalobacteraceae bacterium]
MEMGLSYHFEPGSVRDGVTLAVPLFALNQIPQERAAWPDCGPCPAGDCARRSP